MLPRLYKPTGSARGLHLSWLSPKKSPQKRNTMLMEAAPSGIENLVNNGINDQPQLVSRISEPARVCHHEKHHGGF